MKKLMSKALGLLIITLIISLNTSGQITDTPRTYDITEQHSLTVFARGSLSWEEDSVNLVTLNFTMSEFSTNNSVVRIFFVQFFFNAAGTSQGTSQFINSTEVALTPNQDSVVYEQSFAPPNDLDRFYIGVNFQSNAEGGGVNESRVVNSFRFPSDTTIIVERNNLVPAINLYGFPQGGYFSLWLPIYGTFLFFLLTPSFVVLGSKIKEMRTNSQSKSSIDDQSSDDTEMSENEGTDANEEEMS